MPVQRRPSDRCDRGDRVGWRGWIGGCLLALGLLLAGIASAQSAIEPYQEYAKRIRASEQVEALSDDLLGDSVSLFNGQTEFGNVDIDVPGNNALPVQLRRRLPVTPKSGSEITEEFGGLGNWDVDVPHLVGTFGQAGWDNPVNGSHPRRCTDAVYLPLVNAGFKTQDVFQGNAVHVPGQGDVEMMGVIAASPSPQPDNGVPHKWTTRGFATFTCTPLPGAESW